MNVGIVGLGRMGGGIAERWLNAGHAVHGFDLDEINKKKAQEIGVVVVQSLADIAQQPIIWLMVPPGDAVDTVIAQLQPHLKPGTIIIDGGNSNFKDSMRRAQKLAAMNVEYIDCGTSGGLHGRTQGYCLMVGGNRNAYAIIEPLLHAIAAPGGVAYVGPSGAGHYVKMVHNGIEYALMQAYAEGFQLIKEGSFKDEQLDLAAITQLWNHGSIIRSFLLELSHNIFVEDQSLTAISGEVAEGGTGKWTVEEAKMHGVPVFMIEKALDIRRWSREKGGNYGTKIVALLRNQFGGHAVKKQ